MSSVARRIYGRLQQRTARTRVYRPNQSPVRHSTLRAAARQRRASLQTQVNPSLGSCSERFAWIWHASLPPCEAEAYKRAARRDFHRVMNQHAAQPDQSSRGPSPAGWWFLQSDRVLARPGAVILGQVRTDPTHQCPSVEKPITDQLSSHSFGRCAIVLVIFRQSRERAPATCWPRRRDLRRCFAGVQARLVHKARTSQWSAPQ